MIVHATAGQNGPVFVFDHAHICSGLSHLIVADQTYLQIVLVRAGMVNEVCKVHSQGHLYFDLVFRQEIGSLTSIRMCR